MKTRVLDSWPVLEWINGRYPITADRVGKYLDDAERGTIRLYISAINAGEIYYFLKKDRRDSLAETWRELSRTLPVTVEVPTRDEIWEAASLKGRFPISYADAFAAALAQKHKCPLLTGDPEFKSLRQLELDWLNRE